MSDTAPCPECAAPIRRKDLEKHLYYAHQIGEVPDGGEIKCAECNSLFRDWNALRDHRALKHPTTGRLKKKDKKKKTAKQKGEKTLRGGTGALTSSIYAKPGMRSAPSLQGGAPGSGKKR